MIAFVISTGLWRRYAPDGSHHRTVELSSGAVAVAARTRRGDRFFVVSRSAEPRYPHEIPFATMAGDLKALGCARVVSTAVAGALDPELAVPSLMLVDQFLDLHRSGPEVSSAHPSVGPAGRADPVFLDFTRPYCPSLRTAIARYLTDRDVGYLDRGCYVGVDGPRYETSAEVRAFRMLGGDVIGMTAVREAIACRNSGLCVACVAIVANSAAGLGPRPVDNRDIQREADRFSPVLLDMFHHLAGTNIEGCGCVWQPS